MSDIIAPIDYSRIGRDPPDPAISDIFGPIDYAKLRRYLDPVQQASYIVFTDGTKYYAKNGDTGQIELSDVDAPTVINYAIRQVGSKGGGDVFIRRGIYRTTDYYNKYLILDQNNTKVKGEGIDATIFKFFVQLGTTIPGSAAPRTSNIALEDVTIDGTDFPNNGSGIIYRNVDYAYLRRVKVFAVPFWSIFGAFESGVPMSGRLFLIDCIFDRNFVTRGSMDMSAFNYADEVWIVRNIWRSNSTIATLMPYSYVNKTYIIDTICEDALWCPNIGLGDPPGSVKYAYVSGLTLIKNTQLIDAVIAPSVAAVVKGATDNGTGEKITIGGARTVLSSAYLKTVVARPWGHDGINYVAGKAVISDIVARTEISVVANETGASFTEPPEVLIDNVEVLNIEKIPGNVGGIWVYLPGTQPATTIRVFVKNSVVRGGFSLAYISSTTANTTLVGRIMNTRLLGNPTGKSRTIMLAHNIGTTLEPFEVLDSFIEKGLGYYSGYPTNVVNLVLKRNRASTNVSTILSENFGTATIAAGSTRVTVSHGLAAAPNKVLITPMANVGAFWVENITATSFDIVVSAPPTSSVTFSWYAEV